MVNAMPSEKLQAMTSITTQQDCPEYKEAVFEYTIQIDEENLFTNNYSFDGTLFNADGSQAGFISTGCYVSFFLTDQYGDAAGPCVNEIILSSGNRLVAVVTTAGTAVFGFASPGSSMTITGGDVCALGAIGRIELFSDKLLIYFE